MTRLLRRLRYLLQRDHRERELDDELRFHLEMKRRELESGGLDRIAAATAARRALGNLPLTRDHVRDIWIAPWLQSVLQDVRFAGRLLVKQRGFTLGVVLVLGIGMALTAAMYTVANAILFTGLPGDDDGRIVSLGTRDELGRPAGVSLPDFEDWRDANETFDGIGARSGGTQRSLGTLLGVFAVAGLLLAAVGLYAVTAYSVAQRTQEIGVRMALGATAGQVVGSFVRRNAVPLGLGLLAGVVGAGVLGHALQAFLVGVEALDAATFLFVVALLVMVTLVASLVPARRAARVNPLDALRCE